MVRPPANRILGACEAYWETGTEGVFWAVQDAYGPPTHEGLHILKDGDYLTIFDKADPSRILWQGEISLEYESHKVTNEYGFVGQAILCFWVNGLQRTDDVEQWSLYFAEGHPAELLPRARATRRGTASAAKPWRLLRGRPSPAYRNQLQIREILPCLRPQNEGLENKPKIFTNRSLDLGRQDPGNRLGPSV